MCTVLRDCKWAPSRGGLSWRVKRCSPLIRSSVLAYVSGGSRSASTRVNERKREGRPNEITSNRKGLGGSAQPLLCVKAGMSHLSVPLTARLPRTAHSHALLTVSWKWSERESPILPHHGGSEVGRGAWWAEGGLGERSERPVDREDSKKVVVFENIRDGCLLIWGLI